MNASTAAPASPIIIRRRSSTFTSIANWAIEVQPGSPAPISPQTISPTFSSGFTARRPSLPRRPSLSAVRGISRRRPSITHTRARSGSTSFLYLVDTPTTSAHRSPGLISPGEVSEFDLTNLGYTSVFVRLPHTPSTPSPFMLPVNVDKIPVPPVPQTPPPAKGLKKFRSLGMLKGNRKRAKSVATAASPTTATAANASASRPRHARSRSRAGSISPSSPTHRIAMASKANAKSKPNLTPPPSTTTFKKAKKASAAAAPPLPATLANELLLMQFVGGGSLETHAKRVMEKQAREAAPAGKAKGTVPVGTVYRDESGNMWWDQEEAIEYQSLLPPASPESPGKTWVLFGSPSPKSPSHRAIHQCMALGVGKEDEERRESITSSTMSSSLSVSLNHIVTPAPMDTCARAMHLLRLPATMNVTMNVTDFNSSLAVASGMAARNKRNRRRPAPLKLHSSPCVPTVANAFEDSFAPSPAKLAAVRVGDVSAPVEITEFASGKEIATSREGVTVFKPLNSKIGFKGKAKALFGGF